jgi:hypothetical protein
MQLSDNYILETIYSYAGNPVLNKYDGTYNCGCPICKEGKSWGKKKRLYYYPNTKTFYCFNCSKSWTAKNWIHIVTGRSYQEIDCNGKDSDISIDISSNQFNELKKHNKRVLPFDYINIYDDIQQKFYSNNIKFKNITQYIKNRRLDTAINRPKTFYTTFNDFFFKNRLIIPFYDVDDKISFYQGRAINNEIPKYLGQFDTDKTLYGINNIKHELDYIFILEGPIDAMFIKNGVSIGGLNMTTTQENQLKMFPFHKRIWIIDNIKKTTDKETKERLLKLINGGEKVYRWSNNYKDINEWAVNEKLDEIPHDLILKSLY